MLRRPPIARPIDEVVADMGNLDLEPIKATLMRSVRQHGRGYTEVLVNTMIEGYLRFLELMVRFPEEVIVPSEVVDEIWHTHILDTAKYRDDCNKIFGFYLDHYPYLGTRGADDEAELRRLFARSQELYVEVFGPRRLVGASACGGGGGGQPPPAPGYDEGGSCG